MWVIFQWNGDDKCFIASFADDEYQQALQHMESLNLTNLEIEFVA